MPTSPGYIPGPLVIPQTCQVKLQWQFPNGAIGSNVLGAIIPDDFTFTQADVDDVMDGIVASAGWAELNVLLGTGTRLLGVEIKDVRTANLAGVPSSAPPAVGTSAANALPENDALVVSLRTAQAGRAFRGRVYLGGWTTDALDTGGAATDAAVTAAQDFVTDVGVALNAKSFELAIAHRGHNAYISPATGQTVEAEAAGSVPVTSIICRTATFASQRRRN